MHQLKVGMVKSLNPLDFDSVPTSNQLSYKAHNDHWHIKFEFYWTGNSQSEEESVIELCKTLENFVNLKHFCQILVIHAQLRANHDDSN